MKDELRRDIKKIRGNLSKEEVFEKSKKIKKRLFQMDEFKKADNVLFYVSYDNEVITHEMIKEYLSGGKRVFVPVTDKQNRCLNISRLERWDDLVMGAYGILEPKMESMKEVSIDIIDLVIVPGVAFDESGNRLGHGMGYYDSFLKKSDKVASIGLAFEFQVVDFVPFEKHDMSLDKIITEERVIDCRNFR